jgi:hypothetical protein
MSSSPLSGNPLRAWLMDLIAVPQLQPPRHHLLFAPDSIRQIGFISIIYRKISYI